MDSQSQLQPPIAPLFTQRALLRLIVPLVIESFLGSTIGFVGTIMVATAGEEAVSSVSLVDNVNNLILFFIASLATGGAIIIAQNIGKGATEDARATAKQLLYTTIFTSIVLMGVALAGNKFLLTLIFGEVEPLVMEYSRMYFFITAFSYPFVAIINSVAAIFRSMGVSKTPMLVTLMMSFINITCCAILIYVFRLGVMGAAIAALVSRTSAAVIMLILIRNRRNIVFLSRIFELKLNFGTIKSILRVGLPSGLDSGMFHLGRLFMQSLIASFGTVAIAANAVTGQIMNIVFIPGGAISVAIITVVGQCVGAGDYAQAITYTKRLLKYSYIAMVTLCTAGFLMAGHILPVFNLSTDANSLATTVLNFTLVFTALLHPLGFTLPNALRAAGDVRFAMIASVASMWLVRIILSYVLEHMFRLGLMSVWISMYSDWLVRAIVYSWRFAKGKWRTKQVV